jgi:hypothetical protein
MRALYVLKTWTSVKNSPILNSSDQNLPALKGRVVILNFWATFDSVIV